MNKTKTFFITFFRSLTDPSYYTDVVKAPSSFSFKYFSFFYVVLSVVSVSFTYFTMLKNAPTELNRSLDQLASMYPANMEVTLDIEKSEISVSGEPEPVIFVLPEDQRAEGIDANNVLVIDTSATTDQFPDYKTMLLLTKTSLVTISGEGEAGYRVYPLKEFTDGINQNSGRALSSFTLNKSFIDTNLPALKDLINTALTYAPLVLLPLMFVGYFISRLVYVAFMTLITLLINGIAGKGLTYAKLFQIGLHTVTITDVIAKLQALAFQNQVPNLYSLAFLGITFIAILGVSSKKTSVS